MSHLVLQWWRIRVLQTLVYSHDLLPSRLGQLDEFIKVVDRAFVKVVLEGSSFLEIAKREKMVGGAGGHTETIKVPPFARSRFTASTCFRGVSLSPHIQSSISTS